jgi:hypothetical protein
MHRLMDIGQNISTGIIHLDRFIMIPAVSYIFISKVITGKLEHHCQAAFVWG